MSNDTTTTKSRPTHTAFHVRRYKMNGEYRSEYTAIGAAWPHGDGEGLDIVLQCFPTNGRISIRRNKPKAEQAEQPAQA